MNLIGWAIGMVVEVGTEKEGAATVVEDSFLHQSRFLRRYPLGFSPEFNNIAARSGFLDEWFYYGRRSRGMSVFTKDRRIDHC